MSALASTVVLPGRIKHMQAILIPILIQFNLIPLDSKGPLRDISMIAMVAIFPLFSSVE